LNRGEIKIQRPFWKYFENFGRVIFLFLEMFFKITPELRKVSSQRWLEFRRVFEAGLAQFVSRPSAYVKSSIKIHHRSRLIIDQDLSWFSRLNSAKIVIGFGSEILPGNCQPSNLF
jgi:hypothetical protein